MASAESPGTLILLRHGESTWNLENLFTGWTDVPLSERGVKEARDAGRLMKAAGLRPNVVHESLLLRSIQTTQLALGEMELSWIPVGMSSSAMWSSGIDSRCLTRARNVLPCETTSTQPPVRRSGTIASYQ